VKNHSGGKSVRKEFGLMISRKKGCIFLAKGIAKKMYGKEAVKKKGERKWLIVKLKRQ
jgi:hypothetical protein